MTRGCRCKPSRFLGGVVLAASATLLSGALVPTQYCVAKQSGGALVPWTFFVDSSTSYLYLNLSTQAGKQFEDIFDVLATINSTGSAQYGPPVANIATIVDTRQAGIFQNTSGGSVVTQFSMVHLVRGGLTTLSGAVLWSEYCTPTRLSSFFTTDLDLPLLPLQWTSSGPGTLPTATPVHISVDLFDFNYSLSNGNSDAAHAYLGWTGIRSTAPFATGEGRRGGSGWWWLRPRCHPCAVCRPSLSLSLLRTSADGCIGFYDAATDCLNPDGVASYPCAFANVDLTGTPLSMVRGWH